MKKFFSLIAIFAFTLGALMLASCDIIGGQPPVDPDENKVTVSWYYGSKVLKEEKVEKGSKVESWTPELEDKTFTGWYREASTTEPFDFETVINEDTDIFAAFKSDEFVLDETEYYLCGTGSGTLKSVSWDHASGQANASFERQDVEGANVYKITIDMYAGDRFQVCYGGGWDGQQGIGIMVGAEYCDGVNEYDHNEYTAADKKVAQVLDQNGEPVFVGSDEYNKSFEGWNIICAPGKDGKYTFTLTTYPNAKAYNTLEWELVEPIAPLTKTHDMHFIGSMNGWSTTALESGDWRLNESEDKATWSGILKVEEPTEIKIYNTVGGQWLSPDGNNIALEPGTYAFRYTVAGDKIEYEALDYYVVGTLVDGEENVNFAVKAGFSTKLEVAADGLTATCDFVVYDVSGNTAYNWMQNNQAGSVMSIKVVYGSQYAVLNWYNSAATGDNHYFTATGTYTLVLDLATGTFTATPKE